ncbi:hypothetical protein [Microbacterium sp.]|uniref:hypothetical protein n=1 Tax=Microbacterium sp. TaxID=51671 RepID=UPI002810B33C|nr:hypothetical protein [Microbacterium sp.]
MHPSAAHPLTFDGRCRRLIAPSRRLERLRPAPTPYGVIKLRQGGVLGGGEAALSARTV